MAKKIGESAFTGFESSICTTNLKFCWQCLWHLHRGRPDFGSEVAISSDQMAYEKFIVDMEIANVSPSYCLVPLRRLCHKLLANCFYLFSAWQIIGFDRRIFTFTQDCCHTSVASNASYPFTFSVCFPHIFPFWSSI